jgi:hypothetical protein
MSKPVSLSAYEPLKGEQIQAIARSGGFSAHAQASAAKGISSAPQAGPDRSLPPSLGLMSLDPLALLRSHAAAARILPED